MRPLLLIIALLAINPDLKAQIFGKKDFSIQQSWSSFHPAILNNQSNSNQKLSRAIEIDRNFNFARFSSLNYGVGLGDLRNPDTLFLPYEHSRFMRIQFGLVLHLPQRHTARNWSPNRINPYLKAGYMLDIADYRYGEVTGSRLSSAFKLGAGMVVRLSHTVGILYEFSHNQRVTADYRSFFQHKFGLIINMDTPYKLY